MVITRTPFRISFFGGGTDFPLWYKENGGAVLSTTIDKYCYITCRFLPPFFEHKHRIVYSKIENAIEVDQILHPSVRETMRFCGVDKGIEIHHDGDLPARSGIGSSSAFTVGLLHGLYSLKGMLVSKKRLALEAIHIEQDLIKENVGSQDQVIVAFGGLNKIEFKGDHNIVTTPLIIHQNRLQQLQNHFMLFFTGVNRTASDIEGHKLETLAKKKDELRALHSLVNDSISILCSDTDIADFGKLLTEGWKIKKSFSDKVSTPLIEEIYLKAIKNGAIGGKILGAGGGGFILLFARPENQPKLRETLKDLLHVPFRFDDLGSQVIYYKPQSEQF